MDNRTRIIQELVPGKQISIAHVIANPEPELYARLGVEAKDAAGLAIGIMTMTPAETAIIAGDIAVKTSGVSIVSLELATGTLILAGSVSEVETAVIAAIEYAENRLGFDVCQMTKT